MASFALASTKTFLPNLFRSQPSGSLMAATAALLPTFLTGAGSLRSPSTWTLPSLPSSLLELLPPWVLAVPKKKTSHSRKAMRSANKGLKDKHNIVHCPGCGLAKLAHHLCPNCYSSLSRSWKAKARLEETEMSNGVPS